MPRLSTYQESDGLEVNLVVHEFGCFEESRQRSKQQVLSEGFRLVSEAVAGGLVARPLGQPVHYIDDKKRGILFTYNKKPPTVSAAGRVPEVKAWGSSISDDEIFTINDLEEFRTTESIRIEAVGRPKGWDIDTVSLHELIPQPHLLPSPFLLSIPPPKGQPFKRNKPMFVSPYSEFSLQDHARVSWLIPIRGIFPWNDCARASIFNIPMPPSVEDDLISWNRASLLKFWQFLLDLQKSGSLGALGVSLHVAKLPKSNSDDRKRAIITNPPTPTDFLPRPMENRHSCSTVDYFKIYHDASRTFYVRKAVDSWSYHLEADGMKVRLLKGARLPLLDDISTTILVC